MTGASPVPPKVFTIDHGTRTIDEEIARGTRIFAEAGNELGYM